MTHPLIDARLHGSVMTLTLASRPEGGVTVDFIEALSDLFTDLATQTDLRVVVLQGPLDLGLDLDHWQNLLASHPLRVHRALQQMQRWRTQQLKTLPQALIAVVNGPCGGAALPLIEGCDLVLCSHPSVFSLPASQAAWLGPETEPAFDETPQAYRRSMLHALIGRSLGGEQAQAQGWVTFSVPTEALPDRLDGLTQSLLDKDPLALQFTKETLAHAPHMDWDTSVHFTAAKFAEIKARQAQLGGPSSRAHAIAGFLAGQSKPGLKG
jgi:trans-feruloyl-CoA hydratase/vanillin synthase